MPQRSKAPAPCSTAPKLRLNSVKPCSRFFTSKLSPKATNVTILCSKTRPRPRGLALGQFRRCCSRGLGLNQCGRVLWAVASARMGASGVAVRTCMVRLVRAHGHVSLARLAQEGFQRCGHSPKAIPRTACRQRPLVMALLRLASGWLGTCRDCAAVAADRGNNRRVLAASPSCGAAAAAVLGLGELCRCVELFAMADESSRSGLSLPQVASKAASLSTARLSSGSTKASLAARRLTSTPGASRKTAPRPCTSPSSRSRVSRNWIHSLPWAHSSESRRPAGG